ncbi:MAG: hypothetical protein ACSHW0_13415 [Thalassotalea sp.]
MVQFTPTSKTYPPVILVQTWLAISKQSGEESAYARRRASDLIQLVFGSVEFAERYVNNHLKITDDEQSVMAN